MKHMRYIFRILAAITLTIATGLPGIASAELVFEPPENCTPLITIQQKSCQVTNLWSCGTGAQLENWRGIFLEDRDIDYIKTFGPDQEMVSGQSFSDSEFTWSITSELDNTSLSELMENGVDKVDVTVTYNMLLVDVQVRMVGQIQQSGMHVVIDGETFEKLNVSTATTTLENAFLDVDVKAQIEGTDYFLVDDKIRIVGVSKFSTEDIVKIEDHTPVEVIRPGEDGFFSKIPKYDCGSKTSRLEIHPDRGQEVL